MPVAITLHFTSTLNNPCTVRSVIPLLEELMFPLLCAAPQRTLFGRSREFYIFIHVPVTNLPPFFSGFLELP